MRVSAIPSLGFSRSQLENVGTLTNRGLELDLHGAVIVGSDWGLDLGLGIATTKTNVVDMGGTEPFSALTLPLAASK